MKYEYIPRGVCSRKMIFEIENDEIKSLEVVGGCNGNLKGISSLVTGMKLEDVISRLEGITCGSKPSSCPAQIAEALREYLDKN